MRSGDLQQSPASSKYDFSVIVPTLDAAGPLARLLESLEKQIGVSFESIVVDQMSSDDTRAVAQRYGSKILLVPRPDFYSPPSASRNHGARESQGHYLVHLDADMELPDSTFLLRLKDLLGEGTGAAVLHELDQASGFWSRVKRTERLCYVGTAVESARVIERHLFDSLGGYDTSIQSGEDYDISQRVERTTAVARDHDLWIHHHTGHLSLRKLLVKKFSYGRTVATYFAKNRSQGGPSALDLLWLDLRCYIRGRRQLFEDPICYLAVFPLRALELIAISCGRAWARVGRLA